MNKLSKIFGVIIVVLILALGGMTYLYINARNSAEANLDIILEQAEELQEAYKKIEQLEGNE